MKISVIGTLPSSLFNFRGELLKSLSKVAFVSAYGCDAKPDEIKKIEALCNEYVDYNVSRSGLNPLEDIATLRKLVNSFNEKQTDAILAYTIKPVIWGGIAARLAKVNNFYAMITGLGYAFQKGDWKKAILNKLVKILYSTALKHSKAVIFQNKDNMRTFIDEGIVPESKCYVVNGSGVDLNHFLKVPLPSTPHFLLIARLLGDKGVREYIKAAKIAKQYCPSASFELVGPEDPSPDGIGVDEIEAWQKAGIITYSGTTDDVRPFISRSSVFVLPSYHEGMPRSVLEAMAMGRPILTTDVPGCRDTVIDGENGWLVQKGDCNALAERIIWFIDNSNEWQRMGDKSHLMAADNFDVHRVNEQIMKIMRIEK